MIEYTGWWTGCLVTGRMTAEPVSASVISGYAAVSQVGRLTLTKQRARWSARRLTAIGGMEYHESRYD